MAKVIFIVLILVSMILSLEVGICSPYIQIERMNNCRGIEYLKIGDTRPMENYIFIVMGLNIKNNGYESFSVDPSYFKLSTEGSKYDHSPLTYYLDRDGKEPLISDSLANGESVNGYVAFEVPQAIAAYQVIYQGWEDVEIQYICT